MMLISANAPPTERERRPPREEPADEFIENAIGC
jgi:hypothetical protein